MYLNLYYILYIKPVTTEDQSKPLSTFRNKTFEKRLILYRFGEYIRHQCPKLSFYFVHSQGALPLNLCIRNLLHAPSQYVAIINGSKNVHTQGAHL